ncbi:MAG: hypothetical protein C0462_10745 [Alcanivorax sp.]|nr:hypothetical protein [Alcanivorax sp.]
MLRRQYKLLGFAKRTIIFDAYCCANYIHVLKCYFYCLAIQAADYPWARKSTTFPRNILMGTDYLDAIYG